MSQFHITTTLRIPHEEALERTRAALKAEGFGVVSEIDVRAILSEKLGVGFPRYVILGVCNPAMAHRALKAEPLVGVMMPCSVVVFEIERGTVVSAIDPEAAMGMVRVPALADLAADAKARLQRVVKSLRGSS